MSTIASSLTALRDRLPDGLLYLVKPYFRKLFPNQLFVFIWITYRCNYRCSYCNIVTNFNFGTVAPKESERTVADWLVALEKLPPSLVYFIGGEPFMYAGLPELINDMPGKHSVIGIVSNGTAKTEVYQRIKKKIPIVVSFHREFIDEERFIKKINELKEIHKISVNIVATRENIPVLRRLNEVFAKSDVTLHVDKLVDVKTEYTPEEEAFLNTMLTPDRKRLADQLDYADYGSKLCGAGMNYINIMPNGQVYTCNGGKEYIHSPVVKPILDNQPGKLYDVEKFRMGNLFADDFALHKKPMICTLPCRTACDRDFTSFKRLKS